MIKTKNTIFPLMVAILGVLIFLGCQEDPLGVPDIDTSLPEIKNIGTELDNMIPGAGTEVTVTAQGGSSYEWSADQGTFADPNAAVTTWTSEEEMEESENVTLTCTVSNGSGSRHASVSVDVVVLPNPKYHWPFDTDLSEIVDGNDGIGSGIGINTADPRVGAGCAEFSGLVTEDDVMTVTDDDSIKMGSEDSYSIVFWMKTDSAAATVFARNETLVWEDAGQTFSFLPGEIDSVEVPLWGLFIGEEELLWEEGEPAVNDGEWYLVVVTHVFEDALYQIFINGELLLEERSYTPDVDGTTFYLGGLDMGEYGGYEGLIDNMRYYDVILSEEEVDLLFRYE